jgi:hypothetical protein
MTSRVIDKSAVTGFLDDLIKGRDVLAPAERDGLINFEPIRSGDEALLTLRNTKRPPKETFFPCSETLFTFDKGKVAAVRLLREQEGGVWDTTPRRQTAGWRNACCNIGDKHPCMNGPVFSLEQPHSLPRDYRWDGSQRAGLHGAKPRRYL